MSEDSDQSRDHAEYRDVSYSADQGVALITIERPERHNAFRALTVEELIAAFKRGVADPGIGAVILTGAGDKAFCAGGDQKRRAATGHYGEEDTSSGLFEIQRLHETIRHIPKPVIAAVNGYAIGGGHVLHVLCDLTVASTNARFGQTGPRVGSFDAGYGTAYLARVVGEKRARQIWFLVDQYDAETAERWGLVNEVVAPENLLEVAHEWGRRMCALSPTALRVLKHSFNADTDHLSGFGNLAYATLDVFNETAEAREGVDAFTERRDPDFGRYR